MESVELNIDIEVKCDTCGNELSLTQKGNTLRINPCEPCKETAEEEGRKKGYDDGFNDGKDAGYDEGKKEGYDEAVANNRQL